MAISDAGIQALAKGNTVATMLPGTTVFLGKTGFAPVRKLIDSGVRVAIATDYNPGSSVYNSQAMMMNFAMAFGKMTLEEAFKAATRNAALSLNRKNVGLLEEGAQSDLICWNLSNLEQIPYYHYESAQADFLHHQRGRVFPRKKINSKF
jgi:imidazolonepropionase